MVHHIRYSMPKLRYTSVECLVSILLRNARSGPVEYSKGRLLERLGANGTNKQPRKRKLPVVPQHNNVT